MVAMRTKQQVAKCCPPLGVGVESNGVRTRGTTASRRVLWQTEFDITYCIKCQEAFVQKFGT